eukprot:3036059-Rhodomonas_salina.3
MAGGLGSGKAAAAAQASLHACPKRGSPQPAAPHRTATPPFPPPPPPSSKKHSHAFSPHPSPISSRAKHRWNFEQAGECRGMRLWAWRLRRVGAGVE